MKKNDTLNISFVINIKKSLALFVLLLFSINKINTNSNSNKISSNKNNKFSLNPKNKSEYIGNFYFQKISMDGNLNNLFLKSQNKQTLLSLYLDEEKILLYKKFKKSKKPKKKFNKKIEEFKYENIYSKKNDNFSNGKCCTNLILRDYSICEKENCPKIKKLTEINSNFCLEIEKDNDFMWRICSNEFLKVENLLKKIRIKIIKYKFKGKIPGNKLEKILIQRNNNGFFNTKNSEINNFHWDSQSKWGGKCNKKGIYQSPIDIKTNKLLVSDAFKAIFKYNFYPTKTLIKKKSNEIKVNFLNFSGIFSINLSKKNFYFQAKNISFRFPGEHSINGKRPLGEILLHFNEMNPNRVINYYFYLIKK